MARGIIGSKEYGIELVDQAIVLDTLSRNIDNMRIGDYTFPNNPATCQYSCERSIIRHKYPELNATELEDLDVDAAIITGSGEFFGVNAYNEWDRLNKVFKDGGISEFYHPIYTDISLAVIKKLNSVIEPRKNHIAYSFEIWQHTPPVIVSTTPINGILINTNIAEIVQIPTLNVGDTGDWVVKLQNALLNYNSTYLPIYGVDGIYGSETEEAVRKYQNANNLEITGIANEATLESLGVTGYDGTSEKISNIETYIVKPGDTLSKIAIKYNTTWQNLAKVNTISNPHLITVGQKIKIG